MNTSFLSKVDPLNNELAYVGVVALSLVVSVFVGMWLIWPGDELNAYMRHEAPSARSRPSTTWGQAVARAVLGSPSSRSRSAVRAVDPTASSSKVAEAPAVITVSSRDERR